MRKDSLCCCIPSFRAPPEARRGAVIAWVSRLNSLDQAHTNVNNFLIDLHPLSIDVSKFEITSHLIDEQSGRTPDFSSPSRACQPCRVHQAWRICLISKQKKKSKETTNSYRQCCCRWHGGKNNDWENTPRESSVADPGSLTLNFCGLLLLVYWLRLPVRTFPFYFTWPHMNYTRRQCFHGCGLLIINPRGDYLCSTDRNSKYAMCIRILLRKH